MYNLFQKDIAISLRKNGWSYNLIREKTHIPLSTLNYWFKNLKLSEVEKNNLIKNNIRRKYDSLKKRNLNRSTKLSNILKKAESEISSISNKELWLMGVILFWRDRLFENTKYDYSHGVKFTSSNKSLIKLFLRWLTRIGNYREEDISFDIFVSKSKIKHLSNVKKYWSNETGYPIDMFNRFYFLKSSYKKMRNYKKSNCGYLRVRVKSSSLLSYQLAGWINGIKRVLNI